MSVVNNFNQVNNLQNFNFLIFLFKVLIYIENKIKKITNINKFKNTKLYKNTKKIYLILNINKHEMYNIRDT